MAALCLQSAVLGFGVFRVLERYGITSGLSIGENVILQTTSVATATMPLAAGKPSAVPIAAWQHLLCAQRKSCAMPDLAACLLEPVVCILILHQYSVLTNKAKGRTVTSEDGTLSLNDFIHKTQADHRAL